MPARIHVMLVDDHAVVRVGFRMLLTANPDIEVVAEADSGEAAYLSYAEIQPDVGCLRTVVCVAFGAKLGRGRFWRLDEFSKLGR